VTQGTPHMMGRTMKHALLRFVGLFCFYPLVGLTWQDLG